MRSWGIAGFLCWIMMASTPSAQEMAKMYVEGEAEVIKDAVVSESTKDRNGEVCAVIQIITDLDKLKFDSGLGIAKTDFKPGQYTLFLSPGERELTIFREGYVPLRVILFEHGIRNLVSRSTWRLKVTSNQKILADTRVGNFTLDQIGIKMVSIPAGTFEMGSTDGGSDKESVHSVTLSAFEMSATEITQGQYKAVMGYNPSDFQEDDNLPVENVNWNDAVRFCKALSQKTGVEFRLPTEAEWEYACRAGTTTKYYTGNSETDLARAGWHKENSGEKTHPVGQKTPNAWGLYDMHGNVWEWCADWYGDYTSGSATNPTGPLSGSYRVFRGGCWDNCAGFCRSAYRGRNDPLRTILIIGFRVVRRP